MLCHMHVHVHACFVHACTVTMEAHTHDRMIRREHTSQDRMMCLVATPQYQSTPNEITQVSHEMQPPAQIVIPTYTPRFSTLY